MPTSGSRNADTRSTIKNAARRLFAAHGIENVSVRQIVTAAGQRHIGAIGYYFKSKDDLVVEILSDGARMIDDRRNAMISALEAGAEPITLRAIVAILVQSSIFEDGEDDLSTYSRFFTQLSSQNRRLLSDVVMDHFDAGYRRCIAHLRALTPELSRQLFNQRIIFMMLLLGSSVSTRELALDEPRQPREIIGGAIWQDADLIEDLIDACEGILRPIAGR